MWYIKAQHMGQPAGGSVQGLLEAFRKRLSARWVTPSEIMQALGLAEIHSHNP